jgi:hypothetical protein
MKKSRLIGYKILWFSLVPIASLGVGFGVWALYSPLLRPYLIGGSLGFVIGTMVLGFFLTHLESMETGSRILLVSTLTLNKIASIRTHMKLSGNNATVDQMADHLLDALKEITRKESPSVIRVNRVVVKRRQANNGSKPTKIRRPEFELVA